MKRAIYVKGDIYVAGYVALLGVVVPMLITQLYQSGAWWEAPVISACGLAALATVWSIHREERMEPTP